MGNTARQAKARGLRFDLTLGSGWPFGGPAIPVTQAAGRLGIATSAKRLGQATIRVPDLGHGETLIAAFSGGVPLLAAVRENEPKAIFCCSLEVFGSDWTGDLTEEFWRREDRSSDAAAIRHHWGRTLTELLEEHFLSPLAVYEKA